MKLYARVGYHSGGCNITQRACEHCAAENASIRPTRCCHARCQTTRGATPPLLYQERWAGNGTRKHNVKTHVVRLWR
eukprot:11189196-Lingulodinium_polyedra.AAC.1